MEDKPELLPVACKDVQWARNLVAQMKEGHGRHVSSRQFRQGLVAPSYEAQNLHPPHARAYSRPPDWMQAVPDRRIGTLEGCRVMEHPEQCQIGDLTQNVRPELRHFQHVQVILDDNSTNWEDFQTFANVRTGLFERVRCLIQHRIGEFREEIFWKRIS